MAGDRTEQPTSRRLRDARRKGQLARSKDVVDAAGVLGVLVLLTWFGEHFVTGLGQTLRAGIERTAGGAAVTIESGLVTRLAIEGLWSVVMLAGPFALVAAGVALGFTTLQGGWNVATEALGPHWNRLNPFTGAKRLVGRVGIDLVKTLIMAVVVTWIAWGVVNATLAEVPGYGRVSALRAAGQGWHQIERLLRQTAIALVLMAGADYMIQRWRLTKSLRMTKQEVKDDMKLLEGNQEVKAKIRRMQREANRRRMMADVPKATVVITNPTHYAVALEYSRDALPAPRVLAKGKGPLALRIRELARQSEVPIVENVPLAQSLYRGVEVGDFIPAELFGAVAEVLAYLIRLKQLKS